MLYNENNRPVDQDDQSTGQVREGKGMGGHNFGEDGNPTPTGDDKDNPSRNAGYTNAYFRRTKPTEEDTANNNFKPDYQQGEPDYEAAQQPRANIPGPQELPDQQKVGEDTIDMPRATKPDNEEKDHIET